MADRVVATANGWALASDGIQWILMRRYTKRYRALAFVRTDKETLARCMRETGVDARSMRYLLKGLPDTFDEFARRGTPPKPV